MVSSVVIDVGTIDHRHTTLSSVYSLRNQEGLVSTRTDINEYEKPLYIYRYHLGCDKGELEFHVTSRY
jgi:hypothetical protein